jgi:hypothetical protein
MTTAADFALPPDVVDAIERVLDDLPTEQHRDAVRAELARKASEIVRARNVDRWLSDPTAWAAERAKTFLWSGQSRIIQAVRDYPRVAVKSCNAAGKSKSMAVTAAWWLDIHPIGSAFALSTAPSFAQVRTVLWREIRTLHRTAGLFGRVNQTEWLTDDGDIIAFGRKPADYDPGAFLGIHALYPLVIIDEGSAVPKSLYDAAASIATNDYARIVVIGNPDDPSGEFARICQSPMWHVITISAFDTPNLTGEPVPDLLRQSLVTKRWVEDRKAEWGEDNPLYISRVLAEFPEDAPNKAIPLGYVAPCLVPPDEPVPDAKQKPVVLGVDVGEGVDLTVVRERRGIQAGREWQMATADPEDALDMIVDAIVVTGATVVNVDAGGPGWALVGSIRRELKTRGVRGVTVNPIKFGASSREPEKYKNVRAELWWGVGRLFSQQQAWVLAGMENAETTVAQLCDPTWHYGAGDVIVIESKDDIRKRTGRSPDNADALLLAFATGVAQPAKISRPAGRLPTGSQIARR